jgi:hypothetical protein
MRRKPAHGAPVAAAVDAGTIGKRGAIIGGFIVSTRAPYAERIVGAAGITSTITIPIIVTGTRITETGFICTSAFSVAGNY